MHRLGFGIDEIPLLIERLKAQNAVIARSVFSHFVGSDSPQQFDSFTRQQIETFEKGFHAVAGGVSHIKFCVISVIRQESNVFPEHSLIWCGWESDLYGVSPIDNSIIHNVSTLRQPFFRFGTCLQKIR